MFIVRETLTAKPGNASKLAKLFKRVFKNYSNVRIMTDVVGNYNTVVMEMQVNSLDEFEKELESYKSGNNPKFDEKDAEEMAKYTEMYKTGKREIFKLEE